MQLTERIKCYLLFKIYRLHAHCDPVFYVRYKKWRKYLLKNGRVLEVGPNGGPWTIELLLRENNVTSVDLSCQALDRLKTKLDFFPIGNKNLKLIHSDIKQFTVDEKYDQIILFEVLEHIDDDVLVIKKLLDFLTDRGQLLISAPSDDYIPYYGEELSEEREGGHVRKGYSFKDYDRVFKDLNAKIVYQDSCAGFFTQKLNALQRFLFDRFKAYLILNYLIIFSLRWICWFDFLYPDYPNQINFIIVQKSDN